MSHVGKVVIDGEEVKVEIRFVARICFPELTGDPGRKIGTKLLEHPSFSKLGFISVQSDPSGLIVEGSSMAQSLVACREVCVRLNFLLRGQSSESSGEHGGGSHIGG